MIFTEEKEMLYSNQQSRKFKLTDQRVSIKPGMKGLFYVLFGRKKEKSFLLILPQHMLGF